MCLYRTTYIKGKLGILYVVLFFVKVTALYTLYAQFSAQVAFSSVIQKHYHNLFAVEFVFILFARVGRSENRVLLRVMG